MRGRWRISGVRRRRSGKGEAATVGGVAVGDYGADFKVGGVAAGRGGGAVVVGGVEGGETNDEAAVEGVTGVGGEEGFGGGDGGGCDGG